MGMYCLLILAAVVAAAICDDRVEILKGRTDNTLNNNRRTRPLEAGTDLDAYNLYDLDGHHMHGKMPHGGHHMHGIMPHGGHHMHAGHHGHHGRRRSHHGPHHESSHGSRRMRGGQTGVSSLASLGGRLTPENRPLDADGARQPLVPGSVYPHSGMDSPKMRIRDPRHRQMQQNMAAMVGGDDRLSMLRGHGQGQAQGQGTDDASRLDLRFAGMGRGNPSNLDDGDFMGHRGHHTGSRKGNRGHGHRRGGHHGMHHGRPRIQYGDDSATRYHRRLGPRYQI